MIDLQEAKDFLRVDGSDNDEIISAILSSIPAYIEFATGLNEDEQDEEPMCRQASKFLLSLWYNAEQTDADALQDVITSLLSCICIKHDTKK